MPVALMGETDEEIACREPRLPETRRCAFTANSLSKAGMEFLDIGGAYNIQRGLQICTMRPFNKTRGFLEPHLTRRS